MARRCLLEANSDLEANSNEAQKLENELEKNTTALNAKLTNIQRERVFKAVGILCFGALLVAAYHIVLLPYASVIIIPSILAPMASMLFGPYIQYHIILATILWTLSNYCHSLAKTDTPCHSLPKPT